MHTEYDPGDVAARLRRYIAEHDADRRIRVRLIERLEAYASHLKHQNMIAGALVGRLRRMCAHYDEDVRRLANNKHRQEAA